MYFSTSSATVVPAAAAKGTKVLDANEQGAAALVDVFREIGLLA